MSIEHIIILLVIGYLIFILDIKKENLPTPVILLVTGISLSFIPYFREINLTEDMIYSIFLPGLLFISAYQFSAHALKEHRRIIGFLSTIGLILTVAFLGAMIYFLGFSFLSISFLSALLLASILTPTDPISVVSVLKKSSDNPDIANVVDGESMINDGTSVVLFSVLFNMYLNNESFELVEFIKSFFFVSVGGIGVGLLVGWTLSKAVHLFQEREFQVMLSIIIAYGGFHLAEYFGFSGVLATVTSGFLLSWEFEHTNKADHYLEKLDGFWGVVEPTLLSLLFLFIGIEATTYLAHDNWLYAIIIFIFSIFVRFLIVASSIKLFSKWEHINLKQSIIITWAGIKGTMSVFLLLTLALSVDSNLEAIIEIGFSVVVLSLIFQSIGVYPLSKWLNKY